ncbi:putative membrane protein [Oceanobacillus picturae]|uniref:Membrane protein n=1 Tax=Oceanobacillus picturae TaxID=171693 RepID=W9AD00_9BACI|nr:zinc ribbon domain-containing protein [Oceanobacillus picturae]CDO03574.1 putative membrane protein [Oceanobacillus picturae]
MAYCINCGGEIAPDARFCKHCGKALEHGGQPNENTGNTYISQNEEQEQNVTPSLEVEQHKDPQVDQATTGSNGNQNRKKMNKKSKIILFSTAALIILLIGVYAVGNTMTSPKHVLDEFQSAIEEEDAGKLASLLTTDDDDLEITEESVKGMIALYNAKQNEFKVVLNHLEYQADGEVDQFGTYALDFQKDGKKFLLFDDYQITVNPVYFEVATNYKDTEIIVGDEVVATADKDNAQLEIGPFLPGEHTIRAALDTGFFNLEREETTVGDPNFPAYVDLYLDGDMVTFDLGMKGYDELSSIKLFVNGKDTGVDLSKQDQVGPLLIDGSMNVSFEAELPWGTVRTNDQPLTERYMEFNLGDSDEFKQQIQDILVTYNEEFGEVYSTANPDALTTAIPDLKDRIVEEAAYNLENDIMYDGAFHGMDFYQDSFTLEKSYEGFWELTVDTITYYEEAIYEKGTDAELEQVEDETRYVLAYDQQQETWAVRGIDYAGSMEEDRMERVTVEEPVFHTSDKGKEKE